MDTYTVSFFGHREISQPFQTEERIANIVRDLINRKDYVEFLVGRDGDFDRLVSSTIKRTVREYDYGNSALVLVLPYLKTEYRDNQQNFLDYYDEVEICEKSAEAHFKAAIQIRNRDMVDRSDFVVCCIEHESGGAYKTVQYAKQQGKKILNVSENITAFCTGEH